MNRRVFVMFHKNIVSYRIHVVRNCLPVSEGFLSALIAELVKMYNSDNSAVDILTKMYI